jgi:hypothetical protein
MIPREEIWLQVQERNSSIHCQRQSTSKGVGRESEDHLSFIYNWHRTFVDTGDHAYSGTGHMKRQATNNFFKL